MKLWPLFEYGLSESLPPSVPYSELLSANVLAAALAEKLQLWIAYTRQGDEFKIAGVAITMVATEALLEERRLVIYSIYGYTPSSLTVFKEGFEKLKECARDLGCARIIAYTPHEKVVRLANMLNCESTMTVMEWSV